MQKLPVEVLGRIFVACMPEGPYVEPVPSEAPLLLTLVCHHWKAVADRTPQLWCSLSTVESGSLGGQLMPMQWERLALYAGWLARSRNRPLSLAVQLDTHDVQQDEFLQILQGYRGRFQRLQVVGGVGLDFGTLLDGTHMLEHLTLQGAFEGSASEPALTIPEPQPSLTSLVLDSIHVSQATLSPHGWSNLTHLAVRLPDGVSWQMDEFVHLADGCPNLEILAFGPVTAGNPITTPHTYSNLRSLLLILFYDNEIEPVPHVLVLPGLETLRIRLGFDHSDLERVLMPEFHPHLPMEPQHRLCTLEVVSEEVFSMFDLAWTSMTHLIVTVHRNTGILYTLLTTCPNLQVLCAMGHNADAASTSLTLPVTHQALVRLTIAVWADLGDILRRATLPSLQDLDIAATSYGPHEDVFAFLARSGCPLETLRVRARGSTVWTEEEQAELRDLVPTLARLYLDT